VEIALVLVGILLVVVMIVLAAAAVQGYRALRRWFRGEVRY
jgi:hypothetical protein